ncbi:terpenoid synthase [Aspergillus cavernicola]|uniref:Terpene synthase n=1 Tax=Aspergillus cavernicola TaxID=176166 RepID=A0ABR4J004_9EURO
MAIDLSNTESIWLSLQGQHVQLPNLRKLFPSWKLEIHRDYERARDNILNPWIRRWVDDDSSCVQLQQAELGLFAAIVCADASFDRFCTVAKYFTWYYIWDDIFDCGALKGTYMTDYRQASMQYIQHQLLPQTKCPDLAPYPRQLQKALQAWKEVGSHIRNVCSKETCTTLSKAMLEYMQAVGDANALFENGSLPSLEEYWARRDYAAGIYPGIATIPFVYGVDITSSDVSSAQMQQLWKCTSYLVHIVNDVISLRKELNDGQIENLIPVLMLNKGLTITDAIQASYNAAKDNAVGIETAAQNLQFNNINDPPQQEIIRAFTRGCRDLAAGFIHWSYSSGRYFNAAELDVDNILHFQITKLS